MKFLQLAVATLGAFSGVALAKEAFNTAEFKQELSHRMNNNLYNKEVLLKGAQPHSDAARKLANNNNNGFAITSDFSIQFVQCFSLSTSYDELFGDQNQNNGGYALNLWKNGKLIAEQSYAVFKICYTSKCDNTSNDSTLEYVVDLQTYIQALISYLPEQLENYCRGCEENQETCLAMLYNGYGYGNAYGGNYNGNNYNYNRNGGRKLSDLADFEERVLKNENTVYRQLDCGLCMQYGCIEGNNNNGNNNRNNNKDNAYSFEAASEWLSSIAECYQTSAYYGSYGNYNQNNNNQNGLYAGFLCNAEGTGVEIGMYLDEDCLLYLPDESYSNYMSYFDQSYHEMTADIIEFTFDKATRFSCKDEEVTWTTQDLSAYGGQYYQNQYGNYNNDNGEVADWCAALYKNEAGSTPVDLYTCGQRSGYYYNNNNKNQNNQNNGDYYDYSTMYSWYTYEISESYALDMASVCKAGKKSGFHTFYNSANGNMYTYKTGSTSEVTEFLDETGATTSMFSKAISVDFSKVNLSAGAKFGIIALVGGVVGAIAVVVFRFRSSSSDNKVPLIENTVGHMA